MKRNLAFFIIFVLFNIMVNGQYSTPGTGISWNLDDLVTNSNGVVTFLDNNYYFNNDLVISVNDSISVNINTQVYFNPDVLVTVQGMLNLSPPDSILFTAVDTIQKYKSFRFEDSDGSEIHRCIIEYGGGMDLIDSDILIQNCVFKKNGQSNSTGVIDLFYCSPQVLNNEFIYNEGPAILSPANGECSPLIYGNLFYRNHSLNGNMPQINLGTSAQGTPIQISNNIIEGFYDNSGGIAITTLAGGELECLIDSNIIFNNRYGVTAYGFDISSVISNNIIYDNNIENLPMQGGSGINYWGGTSNISMVFGNEIYGNLWGITNTGDAMPNMGEIDPDTINPGGNKIYDNGNLGTIYALYNNTSNNIKAENNFWGSYNLDSVEQVIFHYPDDESLGFVDYLPIMDSTITNISSHQIQKCLEFYPNPVENYFSIKRPIAFNNHQVLKLSIYNSSGIIVHQEKITSFPFKVLISSFTHGIYILEISDGIISSTSKFMKL